MVFIKSCSTDCVALIPHQRSFFFFFKSQIKTIMENYDRKNTNIHTMPNPNWYICNTTLHIRLKKNLSKMVRKSQSLRSPWYLLWESVFWEKSHHKEVVERGLLLGGVSLKYATSNLKRLIKYSILFRGVIKFKSFGFSISEI